MSEIKPRMVDGVAVCNRECPKYITNGNITECVIQNGRAALRGQDCQPYYRAKVAKLEQECEQWKRERDSERKGRKEIMRRQNATETRAEAAEAEASELHTHIKAQRVKIRAEVDARREAEAERDRLAAVVAGVREINTLMLPHGGDLMRVIYADDLDAALTAIDGEDDD